MATPPAESAADGPGDVLDLTALDDSRSRAATARDRLVRARTEAQAELAVVRADPEPAEGLEREIEQLRGESARSADEADRLRDTVATLQREQEATLALVDAVRTELTVVYQAKGEAETQRDRALAELDELRAEAASARSRLQAENRRLIAQLAAYETRVREELAVLERQVGAQEDLLAAAEAALAIIVERQERASAAALEAESRLQLVGLAADARS